MRVVDPAETADADEVMEYERIANIGNQQLQARIVTPYYGLSIDTITSSTVLLGLE